MYGCIVNKTAGSGKGEAVWKMVEKELNSNNAPYIVSFTEMPQEAVWRTNELLERDVKAVLAVGGDGTMNEAAEALVHKNVPLGVIPAGSGNDFARSLGISSNVKETMSRIFDHHPRKIDVLQTGSRCCLTVTGIGFDAAVAKTVNESFYKKWFNAAGLGRLTYVASVFHVLTSFTPTSVTIEIDGTTRVFSDVWLTAVANAPNYGGNIRISPEAVHNDGYLNICILHSRKKWPLVRLIPKIYLGKHKANENISFFRGKDVHILTDVPMPVQTDGEIVAETPVRIQILKGALTVL